MLSVVLNALMLNALILNVLTNEGTAMRQAWVT
jgi:hypothetical protein